MLNLTINGRAVKAEEGSTILEAASRNQIHIPTLCHLIDKHDAGACRICLVEVEGAKTLQASCITKARDGMKVFTNNERVRKARKVMYELQLSDHDQDCLFCRRNQDCELQLLGRTLGVTESRFAGERSASPLERSVAITRDMSKCILCRRCVTACAEVQAAGVLNAQNRGFDTVIGPAMDLPLDEANCAFCGQCVAVCPTGALSETDAVADVIRALNDPDKRVVVQVAPAVRVAIGEEFGYPVGTRLTGKLAAALRALNFDDVFDTNFAADLTILEEGTEFLNRVVNHLQGGDASLPMLTSCSPGWIKYFENHYPEQLAHLSTCKSPQMMLGALIKSFYAEQINIDPEKLFVVSVMPCTAKKYEIEREEMFVDGLKNVDAILTSRELAALIRACGVPFQDLEDSDFDRPLGLSTGAADIFGVTGGVMEAALRTVYEVITGRELPFDGLRMEAIEGFEQIKTTTLTLTDPLPQYADFDGLTVSIAVTSGLDGARQLADEIQAGTSPHHFIEVMGCPGGCIAGGGQPRSHDPLVKEKRMKAIFSEDESKQLRKSHENPDLIKLYEVYLGEPNSETAHRLLHTHYVSRGLYNDRLHPADAKPSHMD
ncbi:MAG TPA: 2Fe-2S iron-sulfur cluster binding domain-containing protein [Fastidiosipila sp.]|nr:2Fe-2S iron-sulfur cluster binding domain-containing protein [Fastidiosipila sp.]